MVPKEKKKLERANLQSRCPRGGNGIAGDGAKKGGGSPTFVGGAGIHLQEKEWEGGGGETKGHPRKPRAGVKARSKNRGKKDREILPIAGF